MATPFVSGVAALIASRGNFFPCEIRETILGVTKLYPNGGDQRLVDGINWQGGVGRLNAGQAVAWWPNGSPVMSATNWPNVAIFHGEGGSTRYVMLDGKKYEMWDPDSYNERSDQCIPQSVLICIPTGFGTDDPDGDGLANPCDTDDDNDGVPDASDNCPEWANPTQALPTWPVPAGDADCDGFPDTVNASSKLARRTLALTQESTALPPPPRTMSRHRTRCRRTSTMID